jgi:hypothetical protein
MARTVLVDFFSPTVYGAHSIVTHPHAPSPLEWVALAAAVVAALGMGACALAVWKAERLSGERIRARMTGSPVAMAAEFLAAYLVLTLAVWTGGNNDPLYTRFLYPCYVLVFVVGGPLYTWAREQSRSGWLRVPLLILFGAFLAAQIARDWRAEALPVRFME